MSKANHHHTQEDHGSSAAMTWWLTGAVCLSVFGAIFWFTGPGRADTQTPIKTSTSESVSLIPTPKGMTWPELDVDISTLDQERAAQAAKNSTSQAISHPSSEALRDVVRLINDHQFTTHPIPSRTMPSLEEDLKIAISEALTVIDPAHFVVLGEPLFSKCAQGLNAIQEELAKGSVTLEQVVKDADFERHELYRQYCGNMLGELEKRGLVDAKGQWKDERSKALSTILQRYRWAHMVKLYADPITQLSPTEQQIFVRWRVEDANAFDLNTRRKFVNALYHHIPNYPKGVPEAMLAYEAGDKKGAVEILSRYKNQAPDNPTYVVMYKALEDELANP